MRILKVTLSIQSPFLSNQQGALPFGIDAQSLHYNDQPVILGSLVKGNLRELMTEIDHPETQSWLGKYPQGTIKNSSDEFSLLTFSYFWSLENPDDSETVIRKRIKNNKESGTVTDGALRFAEVIETHNNKSLIFSGNIYLNPRKNYEKQGGVSLNDLKDELERLFRVIPALGSNRGIGYGKLLDADIEEEAQDNPSYLSTSDKETILQDKALDILIKPCWPICFSQTTTGNDLISKDYIPSAAIKAILANNMGRSKDDISAAFDQMRICHALYTHDSSDHKPAVLPLSLAKVKNNYYDLSMQSTIELIDKEVPKFQPDWKQEDYKRYPNSPKKPERHLQVRNRHSAENHAAEENGLFSMESLKPDDNHHWRARINLPDTDAETLLEAIINATSDGLFPLGKTHAPAKVELKPATNTGTFTTLTKQDCVVITLQSPAQLFAMTDKLKDIPLTNGKDKLDKLYKESWNNLSDNSLAYQHSYSRQIIKGGESWYKQFGCKTQAHYQPQIFIEKGSVFVFKVVNAETALDKLKNWQRLGLPLPEGVSGNWQENPFLPQNGYAEISVEIKSGTNNHD